MPMTKLVTCAALAVAATGAQAQAFDAVRLPATEVPGKGEGRAGLALIAGHQYLGSDERRWLLVPAIDYRWANGWFAGVGNGVGYRFGSSPQWQAGLRVTGDFGRKESRSAVLRGLGDIPARPEAGAFLNWHPTRELGVTSSLRYGSGEGRDGLVLDLGAHHGTQLAAQWHLGLGVHATWVNGRYMQAHYGITPEQSARSGYAVSAVGAGVRDLRLGVSLMHFINRDWIATLAVSVSALQGDAKDSVIVRERTPVTAILALGLRF